MFFSPRLNCHNVNCIDRRRRGENKLFSAYYRFSILYYVSDTRFEKNKILIVVPFKIPREFRMPLIQTNQTNAAVRPVRFITPCLVLRLLGR